MINVKAKVSLFQTVELSMKANLEMIRLKDTVKLTKMMEQSMKGNGKIIFNMDSVKKHGATKTAIKVIIFKFTNIIKTIYTKLD